MGKVAISVISLGLTFFKGISVEDARQGIVYEFREDSYQGKMWVQICVFSASKVYSKDRDANDYKFKYIHSPSDMPATGLKNDCASQCPAVTIVGSGAGSFKMEASSREKNSPSLK